jgi:serine protease AprX
MATALVVQAGSPAHGGALNDTHTYIVAFDGDQSLASAMDDQIAAFAAENSAEVLHRFDFINAIAISVPDQDAAQKLGSLKNVRYVEKEITFHATLEQATPQVGAPVAWESGYTGKGVVVAVVDTGIDASHPDLKDKVIAWKDIVAGKSAAYDDFGHGTHCAGIIAGTGAASGGKYRGVAPEVKLVGVKVLGKDGSGSESSILAGIEYAMNSEAKIISMSLGSDQHSQAIHDAVTRAVQKGKIVVVAAGNSGPRSGTIGCPSDNKEAITVGAVDKSDNIASFSSRGPLSDGTVKPDVTAPGKDIVSCRATGIQDGKAIEKYYLSMSGTSMACPMVSGTVALMVQKDPSLTPQKAKEILTKTAKRLGATVPNNDYGYGRISVKDILAYMDGTWKPAPTPTPTPGYPTPTPTPTPGYPGNPYPGYPDPGQPGCPCPGYPYPGYPYPGYPYPGYPYY